MDSGTTDAKRRRPNASGVNLSLARDVKFRGREPKFRSRKLIERKTPGFTAGVFSFARAVASVSHRVHDAGFVE